MRPNSEKALWLILAVVMALVFALSVGVRQAGRLEEKRFPQTWLNCGSLTFARNWHQEGAAALGFRLVYFPRSVETPEVKDRTVYVSYPPGAIIPVWLAAKAAGAGPSLETVVAVGFLFQFLVALAIAGIALNVLSGLGWWSRLAGAMGAGLFYLGAGGPFYFHWTEYFSDIVVLLPVALLVWLESYRARDFGGHAWVRHAIPVAVFCGAFTDPLMVFVAGALALWRLIVAEEACRRAEFFRALRELALPVMLAVGLFFAQLALGGVLEELTDKFFIRSFLDSERHKIVGFMQVVRFFAHFRVLDFLALLIPCAAALAFRSPARPRVWGKVRKQSGLILVLVAGCAVQLLLFWNHSYTHAFSTVKLFVPAALTLGVGVGLLVEDGRGRNVKLAGLALFFLGMVPAVWLKEVSRARALPSCPYPALVDHMVRTAAYRDVYLSPVIAAQYRPPMLMSMTRKAVWSVTTRGQVEAVLAGVRGQPCALHFLVLDTPAIAALFSTVPCGKAVFGALTEYTLEGRLYPEIATRLDPLFKGQEVLWRTTRGSRKIRMMQSCLVPWEG